MTMGAAPSDRSAFFPQRQTLMHTEAMLLVDHGERERREFHSLLEQRMGADDDGRGAFGSERFFPAATDADAPRSDAARRPRRARAPRIPLPPGTAHGCR